MVKEEKPSRIQLSPFWRRGDVPKKSCLIFVGKLSETFCNLGQDTNIYGAEFRKIWAGTLRRFYPIRDWNVWEGCFVLGLCL